MPAIVPKKRTRGLPAMSFQLTQPQIRSRTKDVTRRCGWQKLKAGDRLFAVEKCMGLKKGEHRVVLATIEIVSVTAEPLHLIADYPDDCAREGFPELTPAEFVAMFCRHMRCLPEQLVQRIEFRYVD
jgi:hypothetical protein